MPKQLDFNDIYQRDRPTEYSYNVDTFFGVDFSSTQSNISESRSPDAPNMIGDLKGNPVKRTGFYLVHDYGAQINGRYTIGEHEVVHAGTKIYIDTVEKYAAAKNAKSTAQRIGSALYIFDGTALLKCDGSTVSPASASPYIPTVYISKNPTEYTFTDTFSGDGTKKDFTLSGTPDSIVEVNVGGTATTAYTVSGNIISFTNAPASGTDNVTVEGKYELDPAGTAYENLNLIGAGFTEKFLVTDREANATKFQLSFTGLDATSVTAKVMSSSGVWVDKAETTDFTVNRTTGLVTFNTAPGATPVTGEDNISITAYRTVSGYADKVNKCSRSIAYGADAMENRIFACGNPDFPNRDWFCAVSDPTYWPDLNYSTFGQSETEIIGYSILNGSLVTHIRPSSEGRSAILREAAEDTDGNTIFVVTATLQGEEAIAPRCFSYMETEPMFLTARGVYAVTSADVDARQYTQNRSYFVNKRLCAEANLDTAEGGKWKQYYLISINGNLYLLDTSQKNYSKGEPLSTFQYECYFWTNVDATVMWEDDGKFCFGDSLGHVCAFYTDILDAASYHDYDPADANGAAIESYWTFPDFFGRTFWTQKMIRYIAVKAAPYPRTAITIWCRLEGHWEELLNFSAPLGSFSWSSFVWTDFSWNSDTGAKTIVIKRRLRKTEKVGFRIASNDINKAWGLYGFSLRYSENSRHRY